MVQGDAREKLNVAVVGLGFGAEFVPLYLNHPLVGEVVLCDSSSERLHSVADEFGIARRTQSFDEILADQSIHAVHLITPMPGHADQSVAVLESGKHCACAVPMATSAPDVERVVAAQRASGTVYMMMETAVYTREFLHVRALVQSGEFGRIQFLRGAHYSNYENWPRWKWYAPMQYATHALAPLLSVSNTRARSVRALGSGQMPQRFSEPYGNPFPVETAIFDLAGQPYPLAAEVTRTIFQTVRQELESFDVYAERLGFEWARRRGEGATLFRLDGSPPVHGRHPTVVAESVEPADQEASLPAELRPFLRRVVDAEGRGHGGGHGGSHPHLVHEFLSSIVDRRAPSIDAVTAADWTLPGICAHESALDGGREVLIPDLRDPDRQGLPV